MAMRGRGNVIFAGPTQTLLDAQAVPQFRDVFEDEGQYGRYVEGTKPKFRFSAEGAKRLIGVALPITVHFCYAHKSSNLESVTAELGSWDEAGQADNKQASYRAFNRRLKAARSVTFGQVREWIEADAQRAETFAWWIAEFYDEEGPDARFGRRFWATTPYEWGWFKSQVVDRAEAKEEGFELINWDSWENPIVSEEECRKELDLGMPMWEWEMMHRGIFTRPAGAVFDCFTSEHVFRPLPIPREWPRKVGIDFGNVNTAAVKIAIELEWLGEDAYGRHKWGEPTGRRMLYSSYKSPNDDVAAHARAIKEGEPRILTGAGGSHQESGWRQAFRKEGINLIDPPATVRDVEVRIQCLYGMIKRGDLVVFDTEHEVIEQLQSMSRELDDMGRPTEKIKDERLYHFVAALSYIAAQESPPVERVRVSQGYAW